MEALLSRTACPPSLRPAGYPLSCGHSRSGTPSSFSTKPQSPAVSSRPLLKLGTCFLPAQRGHLRVTQSGATHVVKRSPVVVRADGNGAPAEGPKNGEQYDYDLFTIGAGSGGVRGSRFSAQFGAKTAVCELPFSTISSNSMGGIGGTCVIRGCVPKKLMVYSSHFAHDFEASKGFGWSLGEAEHSWQTLVRNKNKELDRLTGAYRNTLTKAGVEIIEGRGKIVGPHEVEVNGKHFTARTILVAVGGRASVPPLPGHEWAITSDEALDLPERPRKILIVGGGYIALEFACIFNGLGSEVHVYMRQKLPLRGFDEEIRNILAEQLTTVGIHLHTEESPASIEKLEGGRLALTTESGHREEADAVMFATGRKPNTKNLGLEAAGVELDKKGAIKVDEYSRTTVPSIYAVGDVTDRVNLTPVALMEGAAFAKTVFNNEPTKPVHANVPSAVFTQPPIATVGLNEEQAEERYGDIDVFTATFKPMKATLSGLADKMFVKLIVDVATDRVVGAHMLGDDCAEIMQGVAIAIRARAKKADFDSTVGIHPTSAEEIVTLRTPTRRTRKEAHPAEQKEKEKSTASGGY